MSRSQILFRDDRDTIDFAKRFLNARISSLDNDVKRCLIEDKNLQNRIGQPAPFPALLYCFSIIDLLASMSAGSKTVRLERRQSVRKKYMIDFMGYKDHLIILLQEVFRHKLVHLSEPAYGILYNGKRIAWKHDERPTAKHMDIQEDNKCYRIFGQKVWHDKIFIIKISHFKDDIIRSVTDRQSGFLAKIEIDKQLRENFKKAIYEILQ